MKKILEHLPDIIILDLTMPGKVFAICDFKSCQKACARMLLSSMAEFDFSGTKL